MEELSEAKGGATGSPITTPKVEKKTVKKPIKKATKNEKTKVKAEFKKVDNGLMLDQNQVPYLAMDKVDDEMIMAEISGKMEKFADKMVYCYEDKTGKQVTGLSWVGVKAVDFHLRRSRVVNTSTESLECVPDPSDPTGGMMFIAKVRDLISGASKIGIVRQSFKAHTKNGSYDNPFWERQGQTKATRNAMTQLFPADWVANKINEWIKAGKYAKLGASGQTSAINSGDRIDARKIQPAVQAVNKAETKDRLDEISAKVNLMKDWTGQEKYFVKQLIQKKGLTL